MEAMGHGGWSRANASCLSHSPGKWLREEARRIREERTEYVVFQHGHPREFSKRGRISPAEGQRPGGCLRRELERESKKEKENAPPGERSYSRRLARN